MAHKRSRAVLVGLGAGAGAFAAAAMISAAVAPTARADAYSDILADIQAEQGYASTAFTNASADFASGSSGEAAGLTQLYIGLDDDLIGVADDLHVGLVDALHNTAVIPSSDFDFTFATPTSYASAVTEAQGYYTEGAALATTIAGLPSTDYGLIALDNDLSTWDEFIAPEQIEAIAGLVYGFPGL
jgi:hypothetical protein